MERMKSLYRRLGGMKGRKEKFITGGGGEEAVRQKRNTKRA